MGMKKIILQLTIGKGYRLMNIHHIAVISIQVKGWTKSGAILAQPVGGRYWMYFGDSSIRAALSDDLLH